MLVASFSLAATHACVWLVTSADSHDIPLGYFQDHSFKEGHDNKDVLVHIGIQQFWCIV